jgi:hypothetical protein
VEHWLSLFLPEGYTGQSKPSNKKRWPGELTKQSAMPDGLWFYLLIKFDQRHLVKRNLHEWL